jgi:chemotaxis protein MotA
MDIGTLIGCLLGFGFIIIAILQSGTDGILPFLSIPSILIVFGGTAAAAMIAFPLRVFLKTSAYIRKSFSHNDLNGVAIAKHILKFSEIARREGILAIESRLEQLDGSFLAKSMQLVVDGLSPSAVKTIVQAEMEAINVRHQCGRNLILNYAKYTPAFGMIGTLIGLVLMLSKLDAETVGPGMAVAVLTTFYGALASSLFLSPIAEKLKQLNEAELQIDNMILQSVLAIQAGEHPRIIQMKLATYLPEGALAEFGLSVSGADESADGEPANSNPKTLGVAA